VYLPGRSLSCFFFQTTSPLGPFHGTIFSLSLRSSIQLVLYWTKIETKDEIKTIALFHVLGLCLEIFKTHPSVGSWSYPEESFFKIGTVPLYSGFMYAAVGSYISQAWRIMKLNLAGPVPYLASTIIGIAIYLNFFANHFVYDIRWWLALAVFLIYRKTWVEFTVTDKTRRMPLVLSFLLIAFFIWIAENISTYLGAWKYPDQHTTWNMVSLHKISSWFLLVIISVISGRQSQTRKTKPLIA
jgi:uncharacterized membrane protein YoaT (DUF817 family)